MEREEEREVCLFCNLAWFRTGGTRPRKIFDSLAFYNGRLLSLIDNPSKKTLRKKKTVVFRGASRAKTTVFFGL